MADDYTIHWPTSYLLADQVNKAKNQKASTNSIIEAF